LNLPRLFAWAWLWLMKCAGLLIEGGPEPRRALHSMACIIARLLVIRAGRRFPKLAPAKKTTRPTSAPAGFTRRVRVSRARIVRALIGSAVRRRLRARTSGARLSALFNALADVEALTDAIARRLARRLSRLCPLLPLHPPADALVAGAFSRLVVADTS
jgi:hypothetical protein